METEPLDVHTPPGQSRKNLFTSDVHFVNICWFWQKWKMIYFYWQFFSLWVSRVLKYPKKCLEDLATFCMSTWWEDSKNKEEIEFSRWLFEGRLRQGKNGLPDGLNWLCYFAGSSKSHRENSISFIFLEFPRQVDMKRIAFRHSKNIPWVYHSLGFKNFDK